MKKEILRQLNAADPKVVSDLQRRVGEKLGGSELSVLVRERTGGATNYRLLGDGSGFELEVKAKKSADGRSYSYEQVLISGIPEVSMVSAALGSAASRAKIDEIRGTVRKVFTENDVIPPPIEIS